jgi:hypothetical protein
MGFLGVFLPLLLHRNINKKKKRSHREKEDTDHQPLLTFLLTSGLFADGETLEEGCEEVDDSFLLAWSRFSW